ncbi:retrovirus-related pol polyprotein from transposon TNT 1-94 [Tanacetum coccineum]
MSDSEDSTVTYTEISSPYEDLSDVGSPGAEGPIFQDPPSPDYVPGPEEPEQAPPSPIYIPFVPEPVYPEFLPVDDEVFPAEEQPMPAADSPTHQSPGYIPESDPEEDPEEDDEEDPEEDPADYPADRGDDRDDEELIRKLKAQIGNMKEVSADSNLSTLEFQSLETDNTQLKEELTAVRIKNDSLRVENMSIKKHYQDLYQSKAESNSNVSSRAVVPEKPKVLAPGLYAMMPKHIPPQKRNNREANTPLPRKETVSLVKKTNVCVNLSTGIKSVTEASKLKSKCETKTHRNLPARSENVKRVDNPLRNLNKRNHVDSSLSVKRTRFTSKFVSVCKTCNECLVFGNHNKCGVKNLNSMNAKNPKVKNDATVKQVWKATGKIFASVGSKWRPTGRKFTLGDTCPLTRITKPEVVPLEKSGSVSTSEPANNVIVTPRFSKKPLTSYKRKDRKLKDISTGSPPNTETKVVNDPVNVNDLSVVQIVLWYLDSGCSRHMTGDRSKLINYVEKFIGLEVAYQENTLVILRKQSLRVIYLRTMKEFVNKTLTEFCESVGITHNTSIPRTPQQNGVVERRNQTLIEAARTMLIFIKAPMFLWAEAVATTCYTLNRSLVHTLHGKTYYELLKGKKPEVKYFWVFGSLCYPTNDYDDLEAKAKQT